MSNFRDEDYAYILGDCLHDIFYVDSSYRGKIAQMRLLSEIIVRKLIDYNPDDQLTIGDKEVLSHTETILRNVFLLLRMIQLTITQRIPVHIQKYVRK